MIGMMNRTPSLALCWLPARERKKARWLLVTAGILCASPPILAQPGMGPTPVGVTRAREALVRSIVTVPGTVEAQTSGTVASEVEGLVVEIVARAGDRVAKGDTLVRMRRTTLEIDLRGARASLSEAEARLELANRNRDRIRGLFEAGVVSRQELDDAEAEATAWNGRQASAAASVARLEDRLDRSRIRAPYSGTVVREHCEVGEWITVGGRVVDLVDTSRLEVVVNIPEQRFGGISVGDEAVVRVTSLPDFEATGVVSAVIPSADAGARTFPVKVKLENAEDRVAAGMLATVGLLQGDATAGTLVPKDAVVRQGNQSIVFVVSETDGQVTAAQRPVRTGAAQGAWVSVMGVEPGERVVTLGNERLFPNVPLQVDEVEYPEP